MDRPAGHGQSATPGLTVPRDLKRGAFRRDPGPFMQAVRDAPSDLGFGMDRQDSFHAPHPG